MGKRIKIGIIFSYDENWIGGTYYYLNLIKSLNLLPKNEKPHLVIISNNRSSFEHIQTLNYPFISYKELVKTQNKFEKIKNRIVKRIFPNRKSVTKSEINFGIDVLFHPSELTIPNTVKKHLNWIPDFQELYLPHFFSKEYLELRKKSQLALLSEKSNILFSSQNAYSDFKKIFPEANSKCFVVNFAVFHDDYTSINIYDIKKKHNINETPYFFSPNQFWQHKNHIIILKAVKKLKENDKDLNIQILFSGKEFDHRNPTYFQDLKKFVADHQLHDNIKFLGFIDRAEQLCFMKNSLAIIQPSLFEGWSSVVEDGKAMNKNIIVSSLDVHKEQLGNKGFYFDPSNEDDLNDKLILFLQKKIDAPKFDYQENLQQFGKQFMKVITEINSQ
jgi:glycosyltransferase involved in cell wall biosynthesis